MGLAVNSSAQEARFADQDEYFASETANTTLVRLRPIDFHSQRVRETATQDSQAPMNQEAGINEMLDFKPLRQLQTNIYRQKPESPENRFGKLKVGPLEAHDHQPTVYLWEAPNIRHNPLYFEDIGLERYGQDAGLLQPVVSGVHFFGRVQTLPLQAMFKRPFSCDYPLGHYRPGNCVPYLHHSFPW